MPNLNRTRLPADIHLCQECKGEFEPGDDVLIEGDGGVDENSELFPLNLRLTHKGCAEE